MVVRITMKAISEKISEPGTPDVSGIEANTAAAKPRGNMTVIKVPYLFNSDFTAAILTTKTRMPRKIADKPTPRNTDVSEGELNRRPVKTKKKERIRKLIWL